MSTRTAVDAFASATSALVSQTDTAGILATLLADAVDVLRVDSIGLLMRTVGRPDRLELLSASSHAAVELELLQLQEGTGPCIEVIESGVALGASASSGLEQRWQPFGAAIIDAGFRTVHAYPLRWRGVTLGALNTYSRRDGEDALDPSGQTFADIATLIVTQQRVVTDDEVGTRVQEAIRGRIVIERAKGVLAYREGLDTASAYDRLRQRATEKGVTLSQAAEEVVSEASRQ